MAEKSKTFRKTLSVDWDLRDILDQLARDLERPRVWVCNKCLEYGISELDPTKVTPLERGGPRFSVNISMDKEAKEALETFAKKHDRSLSLMCIRAIQSGVPILGKEATNG